jgi:sulfide dehydrogenase [flavocytochrome c] flavoprotein subunit
MTNLNRRHFSALFAGTAATGMLAMPNIARAAKPKVVVVGGGAGGATAARYLAKDSKGAIDVTLVEASKRYYTCFFSNLYLGGYRDYDSIGHGYDGLAYGHGVNMVHDWASSVDTAGKKLMLASGASLSYDKLVLSPGIDIKYDSVAGYSVEAQKPCRTHGSPAPRSSC